MGLITDSTGEVDGFRLTAWAILLAVLLLGAGCFLWPKYNVYSQRQHGAAELARAMSNRQIAVQEAMARESSSVYLARADSIRAHGVASANQIIGRSLKDNPEYLTWLKIEALKETGNQVIYVPTEAQLPITEATRIVKPVVKVVEP